MEREYQEGAQACLLVLYILVLLVYNSTAAAPGLAEETVTWSLRGPHRDTGGPG